jgi:cytosine/adenosine deaminase-related metal-dependent hydrolase
MKVLIVNANIVVPHKERVLERSSLIAYNGIITRIDEGVRYRHDTTSDLIIDADEGFLIPGLINSHSHGFTLGPLFPSAAKPLPLGMVFRNLNRHLLQGTTTLLNLDGFALPEEVEIVNKLHPVKVKTGTSHTPLNVKAAELADGSGLTPTHKAMTVEEMLRRGAVAIGEIGGGHTLAGGGAVYLEIPQAIEKRTGRRITPAQASKLLTAVLGRYADPSQLDREKVSESLKEIRLDDVLTVDDAIDIVMGTAYKSVETAREGIKEAAELALRYNVPMIVHTAPPSKKVVLEVARKLGPLLIAGHTNHPTFEEKEMLQVARELRSYGAIIDLCSGDGFGARQLYSPEAVDATLKMLREGLGDIITTDYMGGYWDPMLLLIKKAVEENVLSLPKAIAMATYNVARAIPALAQNAGTIDVGKTADLVVLSADDISRVRYVLIDGIPVVVDGKIRVPSFLQVA